MLRENLPKLTTGQEGFAREEVIVVSCDFLEMTKLARSEMFNSVLTLNMQARIRCTKKLRRI